MPLTPADIHHVEFPKAAIGRRGYDEEQVDTLLDEISQEMISLLEENDLLQRRAGSTPEPAAPRADRSELNAVAAELDRARSACDRAEAHARDLRRELDQARAEATRGDAGRGDTGRHSGGSGSGPVLAMAQRSADDHMREAHEQADAVLAEAREKSDHLLGEARVAAGDLEQDARRKQGEAIAGLQTRREQVLREIGELTELAQGYRAALEKHISRQHQYLDGTAEDLADEA
ncbi:DivIVA domain-containing protein [Actinoplanes sp. NPDC049265]|uniref:DivIVA domain-containing protein n=1 Tax=Actinoplanes sp. NPDC049265 TaxID=3363902 RepID=UPI0037185AFB